MLACAAAVPCRRSPQVRRAVSKVEPPNWWAGTLDQPGAPADPRHATSPGRGSSARGAGAAASTARVNAAGTYAVRRRHDRPRKATPGSTRSRCAPPRAPPRRRFELLAPLPRAGPLPGLLARRRRSTSSCPTASPTAIRRNDDPPQSRGLLDRTQGPLLPRRRPAGRHRPACPTSRTSASRRSGSIPVYDNNNRLNRKETYDGQPITDYHGYGADRLLRASTSTSATLGHVPRAGGRRARARASRSSRTRSPTTPGPITRG